METNYPRFCERVLETSVPAYNAYSITLPLTPGGRGYPRGRCRVPEYQDMESLEEWLRRAHTLETEPEEEREKFLVAQRYDGFYGFPLQYTHHVSLLSTFSPLPAAHPLLPGVTNIGGRVVPVIDLAPLLDLTPVEPKEGTYVVVVRDRDLEGGILVHRAVDIHEVPLSHIRTEEKASSYIERKYTWPVESPTWLVLVLNVPAILEMARRVYG